MSFEVGRLSAALTLDGVDQVDRGLDRVGSKFRDTGKAAQGAAQGLASSIRQAATQAPSDLNLVGSAFTKVGLAAAAASTVAITKWANFDQAMSNVSAATHESADNMKLLEQAALEAGARTVFSATEAANAIEELAKAGVSTKDILAGGLDGALDLAAAGGLGVAEAAGIAATALKTFKLEGADMAHVADLLAAGAGKAMGDVTDLSAALNQSAMVANATGLSIEETTAGLAAFASQGLLGSDAGTSFKSMLQSLTPSSAAAKTAMDELGISAYDQQGRFIGLAEFAGNLQEGLKGLSVEQQQAALKTIFGSDAIRAATVLYSEGEEGIRKWEAAVNDQGYAAETAAARLDNLKGDLEALGGALDTAFIQTGSGANDALRDLVQLITGAVDAYNALPAPLQSAALGVGLLTAGVGLLGGALMRGVVNVAEFRAASATLGMTGANARRGLASVASFLGGPWGIALAAASLSVHLFNSAMDASKTSAETFTNAIKQGESAVAAMQSTAEQNEQGIAKAFINVEQHLQDLPALADKAATAGRGFWSSMSFNENAALDSIKELGSSLATLASSDLPQAQEAFAAFVKDSGLDDAQALTFLNEEMGGFKSSLLDAAEVAGLATDDTTLLKLALGEISPAAADGASAADGQATSLEALAGVAQSTSEDVAELSDQIRDFGGAAFDVEGAAIKLQEEYRALSDALAEGGQSLDITTEAGGKTVQQLLDIASAANESAGATFAMTGRQEDANAILDEARQKIIDARTALGESPEVAAAWADRFVSSSAAVNDAMQEVADKIAEIPSEKKLYIDAETAAAYEGIEGVQVMQIDDKTAVVVGDNDDAMAKIHEIAAQQPPDKIFQISADAADAYAGIDGVNVKKVDGKTAYVWGNNAEAVQAIEDVNAKQTPRKVVTIDGDSSKFEGVWSGIVGRVGEAWVNVFGRKTDFAGGIYGSGGQHFAAGGFTHVRRFAAGGFPPGMYQGRLGGIWKPGIDGLMHNFAEAEHGVPWEAYLSGKPEFRGRNIALALQSLTRLGFPVVPASQVYGTRAFATGDVLARRTSAPTPSAPVGGPQVERRRRRRGPLAEVINIGVDAGTNDLRTFADMFDRFDREG